MVQRKGGLATCTDYQSRKPHPGGEESRKRIRQVQERFPKNPQNKRPVPSVDKSRGVYFVSKVNLLDLSSLHQVQRLVKNRRQREHLKLLINHTPRPSVTRRGPYESGLRKELGHRQRDHGMG